MSGAVKILVVDDEPQIQRFLKPSLEASGFRVVSASTADEALRCFRAAASDLVILDLGLPDADGKIVLTAIRQISKVPIIVLSARDRESEKIEALDLGADDFVNKPFGIGELLARVRSALRRSDQSGNRSAAEIVLNGIRLDLARHTVEKRDAAVHLTPKEFELLALLMRHAGKVITHRQLLHEIWGPANVSDSQYLRVFIGQLRAKLEDEPSEPALILTEPGVGYRSLATSLRRRYRKSDFSQSAVGGEAGGTSDVERQRERTFAECTRWTHSRGNRGCYWADSGRRQCPAGLPDDSKLKPDLGLLTYLPGAGRTQALRWLGQHKAHVGRRSTVDLKARFLSADPVEALEDDTAAPVAELQPREAG